MAGEFLKEYYAKLQKEGLLKALLCALVFGFSALLVTATLFWFMGWKKVWICAIVFVLVTAIVAPLFYFLKYKPDKKYVAMRIDELGLEERMLTMTELEGQDTFIARAQREDALKALNSVNASFIKLAISLPLIIGVAVSGVLGLGMTTVSALSAAEIVPPGGDIVNPPEEDVLKEFEVIYEIEEGEGTIEPAGEGDGAFQIVLEGEDAAPVLAIPDEGWMFVGWSDGPMDPYRHDLNITENLTVYAIFAEAEEGDEGGDGEGDSEGDSSQNKPNSEGNGQSESESEPSEGSGAGGRYEPNNQVIDGETYYGGEVFEGAYEDALDKVNKDGNIDGDDKDAIGGYFDNIRQ